MNNLAVKIWLTNKRPEFSCANLRFLGNKIIFGKIAK